MNQSYPTRKEYRITQRGLIEIPDPNLRSAVVSELGNSTDQITTADMSRLTSLESTRTTMSNLAGLESAINLNDLNLWGNAITDITPLSGLKNLTNLNLGGNAIKDITALSGLTNLKTLWLIGNTIADISPLVANTGLDVGDYVDVRHNPLSEASINTHVPKLQQRGVKVRYHATQEPVQLRLSGACVGVGDTFTISLIADDVKDLAFWKFWFNFSPKIFTVVSVNEGDLLKKDGGTTSFQEGSVEIRPDNSGGWIRDVRAVRKSDLLTKDGKTPFSIQRHLQLSLATPQPDNSDRFKKVSAVRNGNSVSGSGELVSITFVAKKAAKGGLGGLQLGLYQKNGAEIPWEVTSTGQVIVVNSSRDVRD